MDALPGTVTITRCRENLHVDAGILAFEIAKDALEAGDGIGDATRDGIDTKCIPDRVHEPVALILPAAVVVMSVTSTIAEDRSPARRESRGR
jgi:hypothetical protein